MAYSRTGDYERTMHRSIAVLSDVHGVLPALELVLRQPEVQQADVIVVTGDLVAGPQPVEVLDRLTDLGERVVLVRGNADRDVVTAARGGTLPEGTPPVDLWAARQLSDAHLGLLEDLPHPVTLSLEGVGEVMFCHGSPRDDNEVVLVDTRLSLWTEVFAEVDESVRMVVCGHTHMPFMRLVDRRLVINSGSIGMPYGSAGLPWVLLTPTGAQLRWAPVDRDAIADAVVSASDYPGVADWATTYLRTPPSDAEAIEAFAPRDGRPTDWNAR